MTFLFGFILGSAATAFAYPHIQRVIHRYF